MPAREIICAPVAQSVSAPYLYSSIRPKLCGGCEFEPHLEHDFDKNLQPFLTSQLLVDRPIKPSGTEDAFKAGGVGIRFDPR